MKKLKVLSILLCLILSVSSVTACTPTTNDNNNNNNSNVKTQLDPWEAAGFELPHVSGIAETESQYDYNADLFYRNETQVNGADPACIYISLEDLEDTYNRVKRNHMYKTESGEWDWIDGESEEKFIAENGTYEEWVEKYGNRYYMATTGNTTSITNKTKALYGSDIKGGSYGMKTSYDLVNWERCGLIEGHAIAIREGDWSRTNFWAPEFIRDKHTGYYFMVFSSACENGNASTTYPSIGSDENKQMFGQVAMSENPLGPYEFITAEEYIYIRAAKNKDGSVKTGDELIVNEYSGAKYYEVYDYEGNVVGYKNGSIYYNLVGYEVTRQTPVFNAGYYYPRYVKDSPEKTTKVAEMEAACNQQIKADGKKYYNFGGIDYFPAVDDEGNLFVFFTAVGVGGGFYGIWCVEMMDYISPKWETLRMVMKPNVSKVVDNGTFLGDWQGVTDVYEGTVNEATEILYHEGRWYLAYSYFGYTDVRYSVGIAVSDNALGPYDKMEGAFNPVIGKGEEYNNYKAGTGHHVFVTAGEELFILYHATHNPEDNYDNNGNYLGRHIGVDRAIWKYVPELGYDMLFGNGATVNLQPKPETITGYTNVAKFATVTGNGDVGEVENVNDGMFTAQPFSRRFEYGKTDGGLSITLTWDEAVEIKAFMIYNAGSYYQAFNKVNMVRMKLAERPAWYTPTEYNEYCYIENLLVDPNDQIKSHMVVRHGSAAIAEFNPIKITEMTIYISGELEDKYTDTDEEGFIWEGYKEVHVSDIYIFGNKA